MAVVTSNTRTSAQIEYKVDFDESGSLGLPAYTKTVGYVKETATNDQIYAGVKALFAITVYAEAPYIVYRSDKSELIND